MQSHPYFRQKTVVICIGLRYLDFILVVALHCISHCATIHYLLRRTPGHFLTAFVDSSVDPVVNSLHVRLPYHTKELCAI